MRNNNYSIPTEYHENIIWIRYSKFKI